MAVYKDTTPAQKYGPTPIYGDCEVEDCESTARMTCAHCSGHFCLSHGERAPHACRHDRAARSHS